MDAASELRVVTPDSAVFGGVPLGEATDLVLHLEPQSLGPRAFKVTLFTNDPFQSERVVTLSAVAVSLPACALQVAPLSVAFLTPIPDAGSVGEVRFTNTGNTRCVLDDVRLASSFSLGFELTAGGVTQLELAPGGVHVVTVRGPAQDDAFGRSGALLFHVFNRDTDQQFIGLRVTP